MRVALLQFDGKLPNRALMRLSAALRARGDSVDLYRPAEVERNARGRYRADLLYGSLIFDRSRPLAETVLTRNPGLRLGGTGWRPVATLADVGVEPEGPLDYSLYPDFEPSLGYTSRGCRRRCPFCLVPRAEGGIRGVATVPELYRGEPHPRRLLLLDNDFLGQPEWRERLAEVRDGAFRICLNQGIDLRSLTAEQARALASVDYRAVDFSSRRIYAAWDRPRDERTVLRGIRRLLDAGVEARHLMLYQLVGFEPGETAADREKRFRTLDALGVKVYPMPYRRERELLGFHRWVVYGYFRRVPWASWVAHGYQAHFLKTERCDCPECLARRATGRFPRTRRLRTGSGARFPPNPPGRAG